jgi:hypothetical protein
MPTKNYHKGKTGYNWAKAPKGWKWSDTAKEAAKKKKGKK